MKKLTSIIACAAALLLACCDNKPTMRETLPPDAAAELNELIETLLPKDDDEELLHLLEDYDATGNVALTSSPTAVTPLHVAVKFRREALARELLRQGADPNAQLPTPKRLLESSPGMSTEMDAPITWVLVPQRGLEQERNTTEQTIRFIDLLVAAGAKVDGAAGGHALLMCTVTSDESVFLHLLELGASPTQGYQPDQARRNAATYQALRNGWRRAAEKLNAAGFVEIDRRFVSSTVWSGNEVWEKEATLLYSLVESYRYSEDSDVGIEQRTRDAICLVLDLGADVNSALRRDRESGISTPMLLAVEKLPLNNAPQAHLEARGWLLLRLLQHGGDLNARLSPDNSTVLETLRSHPRLAAWLQEHGYTLPTP